MRDQEIIGLWEAYSQVYELDEAITSEKGKAKAAEMIAARTTASGRAKPGKGANVAQIKQIRVSDKEGLGGTPMTPTMAKNPVKKKNYFGTGNKAARRAGTYKEEVETWVNSLIEEGYDLSEYSWDDMYEMYIGEVHGIEGHINPNTGKSSYGLDSGLAMTPKKRMETRANSLQKKGEGKRANKIRAVMKRPSMGESFDLYDIILSHLIEEGYAESVEQAEAIMVNMSEDWRESIVEEVLDEGQKKYPVEKVENAGNRKVRTLQDPNISPEKKLKTTNQLNNITTSFMSHLTNRPQPVPPKRKNKGIKESYDLYDIILSHLLDEGYAETVESAEAIMVNMSEGWRQSILG